MRRQRGSAAIEFGLTLPIGLVILAGAIDGGVYMVESTVASRAARDGARVGSMTLESTEPPTGSLIESEAEAGALASLDAAGFESGEASAKAEWFQDTDGVAWVRVDVEIDHEGFFGSLTPFGGEVTRTFFMVTQEQP